MPEVETAQQFYITTKTSPSEDRPRVLKHGDLFAVFNRYGDIVPEGLGEEGLFYEGTRFLSESALYLGNARPLCLSSIISRDNFMFVADLTNVDVEDGERPDVSIPRGTLHLHRSKFLWKGTCYDKLRIANYGLSPVTVPLRMVFDSDFADIFEVRGITRERRGQRLENSADKHTMVLSYVGVDRVLRESRIRCVPEARVFGPSGFSFEAALNPKEEMTIFITTTCERSGEAAGEPLPWDSALATAKVELQSNIPGNCKFHSADEQFNRWIDRSLADVQMMIEGNPEPGYPYAGVPWFSTVFGRDGVITALECLWFAPAIAKGVLRYLAENQATGVDAESDAEPGKILHEMRRGEMAALGEVPFGKYYGSVDSTPLFIMLAGAYYERTGDTEFIEWLWPHVEAALDWIDHYGDSDGDGFVEYSRRSGKGLVQQGWKDSNDSVFHADGVLAPAPIALCEVQGYVYAAKLAAARLATMLDRPKKAAGLSEAAAQLQVKFDSAFWCEDIGMYAIALDGDKRPCRVRASNAGHCLYAGIARPDRARVIAHMMLGQDFFSGWGVRTLGAREIRYNPLSYHNGSVWPHDNALIAAGLARYGFKEFASRIFGGMLATSSYVDLQRLPELFCGLHRRQGEGPTLYPVACSPQAWAAGSVFMLLQACLGLTVNESRKQIVFDRADLPETLTKLSIKGLEVGQARVDLFLERAATGIHVHVLDNPGKIHVIAQ